MVDAQIKCVTLITSLFLPSLLTCGPSSVLYTEVNAYHNETQSRADFAFEFVQKLQNSFRQWFLTIIFCEFTYFENRILKYTETYKDGYPVLLLSSCPNADRVRIKPKIDKHGLTTYVVSSNELSTEVNEYVISALVRTGVWKPRSAVIFVMNVQVDINKYFYHTMKIHFQLLWSNRITNSVLVILVEKIRIYTFNPFFDEVLEITDNKDIITLLSDQYKNLYGKELRLGVFRKIYISDETGPVKCDSRLATTVMNFMNATCKPLAPRDGATVGGILDNGTATGVTADLIDGYTELELNSRILQNSYYGYIDTTYPFAQDELCFLVKKSEKQSSYATTLKLLKTEVLSMFAVNVLVMTLVAVIAYKVEKKIWYANSKERSVGDTILDLVKCFLRQTQDVYFLGPVYRALVLLIMIYSLIINSVVDGIITSAITYPRFKPDIDTLADLAKTNLTLAIHVRHFNLFKASLNPNYEDLLESPIEVFSDKQIKQAIEQRKFQYAILLRKTDALHISKKLSNMKNGRPIFHTVLECPLPCFIVYGLEYGSPYLPRVNKILHYLSQAGILNYWAQSDDFLLYQSHYKILYAGDNQDKKPLRLENLAEVFYVWFIGLFISWLAFVAELLYYQLERFMTRTII